MRINPEVGRLLDRLNRIDDLLIRACRSRHFQPSRLRRLGDMLAETRENLQVAVAD